MSDKNKLAKDSEYPTNKIFKKKKKALMGLYIPRQLKS